MRIAMLFFYLSMGVSDALQHNTTSGDCTSGTCAVGLPEGTPAQPLLCIVLPYRDGCGWNSLDRSHQLIKIIDYLTHWLIARGHSDFLFIVSEQAQTGLFNKGLMMNLGALAAFEAGCEHLCFHDVDQFPENPLNDYFYRGSPTHLCTWSSQFGSRDVKMRPHVGGALLMSRDDYVAVNGFSNFYWRWGFEDNDMYERIHTVFGNLTRLPQAVGTCIHALSNLHHKHTQAKMNPTHKHTHKHTHTHAYTNPTLENTHARTFSVSRTHTHTHTT